MIEALAGMRTSRIKFRRATSRSPTLSWRLLLIGYEYVLGIAGDDEVDENSFIMVWSDVPFSYQRVLCLLKKAAIYMYEYLRT